MRKSFLGMAAATLVALAAPLPVLANPVAEMNNTLDTLFGDHTRYHTFFDNLKKAVAAGDKAAVAAMIEYPFQVRIGGKSLKIRDAAHFIADYDQVITARVKHALQGQTYETLFANWQGVMVGQGEIWFSGVGDADVIKVTVIND